MYDLKIKEENKKSLFGHAFHGQSNCRSRPEDRALLIQLLMPFSLILSGVCTNLRFLVASPLHPLPLEAAVSNCAAPSIEICDE